jgi:hypothetical protein
MGLDVGRVAGVVRVPSLCCQPVLNVKASPDLVTEVSAD